MRSGETPETSSPPPHHRDWPQYVADHWDYVHRVVRNTRRHSSQSQSRPEDLEDITQDAVEKALRYPPAPGSVSGQWRARLVLSARAACVDHLRKALGRGRHLPPDIFSLEAANVDDELPAPHDQERLQGRMDLIDLADAMSYLTERQQRYITLAMQGYSGPEIGRVHGTSEQSATEYLSQIKRRLRKHMNGERRPSLDELLQRPATG
jgi:RNA polymerase sigma factor (sigma-70 family)